MRFIAKLLVLLLSLFGAATVIAYFYGYSIVFPFSISEDTDVPAHRLHAVRLATFTTFVYFGFRYLFFGATKLHPIQFLGVFLFNLGVVGGMCFYVNKVDAWEFILVPFFILISIILYNAGKPEFRNYFKK
jgi:hypothetical protein